jgi:3-oxoadipate enol-lactonase
MLRRERIGDVGVAFEITPETTLDPRWHRPTLVLLPPFPFDRRVFDGNVSALVSSSRRVIVIDYPGFGDSPMPPRLLSISQLADLVAGVLDRLTIKTATLAGVSMGGYVALAFAVRFPERLEALVLANTRAAADSPTDRLGRAAALSTIREQGAEAYLTQSLPRLLSPDAAPALLARVHALAEKRPQILAAGITALRDRQDRSADLPRLRCPTLVLVGQADQVSPPAEMQGIADAINGARFLEIPRAGHLSNLEAPAAFNQAVIDFLNPLSTAPLTAVTP